MENSLIEYKGSLLEVNSLENHLINQEPHASTITRAGDSITNTYGMIGFLLTDHCPEEGRYYWLEGEFGATTSEQEWNNSFGNGKGVNNLRAKCKSVPFPGTFKLVRYMVMPECVHNFFANDRYLGEPIIEKIMKEDLIPDTWCDPNDWEEHKFPFRNYYGGSEKGEDYKKIITDVSPLCKDIFSRNHRAWQSFHLHQDYPIITKVAQESLIIALSRFDQFLERSDRKNILNDQKRNLQGFAEQKKLIYLSDNN